MCHNPRCRRSSLVLRRAQSRDQESVFRFNSALFGAVVSKNPPEFQVLSSVFLDSVAVVWKCVLDGEYGVGSNFHRRVAFVFRFFPTSR